MTESLYQTTAINRHEPVHNPLPNVHAFHQNHRFSVPLLDGTQEDDGPISCICGFDHDDGSTVECDTCKKWQHILCYYPEYEGRDLPDELQHFCVDCQHRFVDVQGARHRQNRRREQQQQQQHAQYNGAKRQLAKSHKKKVKDPAGSPYTNGWPVEKAVRHDRNSASPRDQPPPAKRPKTSHRTSDSTTTTKGHTRKRTATNAHRRSVSRSPESPIGMYSEEFMRCYRDDGWVYSDANVMDDLRVTNHLSEWLQAPDDVFMEKIGARKPELLNRWDGDLDDIPGKVPLSVQNHHDPSIRDQEGAFPSWQSVTVADPLAAGAFIGELRGRIGFKEEYKNDLGNRWSTLRHPEPFVFFHPKLPIYIDARNEGTELRFVRRSCHPNARLQVLVTNGTDYHFCFMALTQIDPGMEVAVAWDTQDSIMGTYSGGALSDQDMTQLSTWVSTVLANYGPCACQLPVGECSMSRFDRRRMGLGEEADEDEAQSVKMPKAKRKKAGQHISPLNTHALNSRSGSEARKVDPDDEPTDSRSASGSAGRESVSRDNTPHTNYSANGSLSTMPELSERERKKLAKEEEMFRRQEQELTGKQSKKKRHSAGSTANTPGVASSKQLGAPSNSPLYADAGTLKQTGLPAAKTTSSKRPRAPTQKSAVRTQIKIVKRPTPSYVDSETQCDMDTEDAQRREAERAGAPRKKFVSLTQRLLQRCATNNVRNNRTTAAASPNSKNAEPITDLDVAPSAAERARLSHSPNSREPSAEAEGQPASKREGAEDTAMVDAPPINDLVETPDSVPRIHEPSRPQDNGTGEEPVWTHKPAEPPAPPWHSKTSPHPQEAEHATHTAKPVNMHLQMPPPPPNPFAAAASQHIAGSPNGITGSVSQSPASLTAPMPLFSPSVTAAVTPSPARKKMSLSEYRQRKNKDRESDPKADRESSPASVASGPTAPMLQHSSSEAGKHSQAIEDDVKMEDVGPKA